MDLTDVTLCVATYGDNEYADLAQRHAIPSARATGAPWVHVHTTTGGIHEARNACLDQVKTEWVAYIDSDDELEPGYLQAAMAVNGDVRVPYVRYVTPGTPEPEPIMPKVAGHRHVCRPQCLRHGNWIIIGAVTRTALMREVGGWRDYGWEDWDLWLRCHLSGATIQTAPGAVYRANIRPGSRGRYTAEESLRHHRAVAAANGVPSP